MTDPITDPADSPRNDDNLVDGRPGDDAPDLGATDTGDPTLTTDDEAQADDREIQPGNS
ncbi:hypothetical protein [Modestobacter sp. Leaf380]|uniref:hypothetical protein n=1 Tax=Modestobacter sp. Leaf380 TaxID=1736356 RepID=UPI0012F7BB7C|nr:hypothetical protein [Modestobacter sp. Leaf380]